MTTEVEFESQYASDSSGLDSLSGSNVTVTAAVNDGTIEVGDQVTVSGLTGLTELDSGISDGGTATFVGTGTFNGETGFVFTVDGNLTNPDDVLVLTQAPLDSSTLAAVSSFAQDTSTQSLTSDPACFAEGTRVSVPGGAVAVEDLQIGDVISKADGGTTRVLWIGHQTLMPRFNSAQSHCLVRIQAGALAANTPERDLLLTGDHALAFDGLMINAAALINGTTIDWEPAEALGERYTVYHIETENHDVILAEGTAAETFVDYVTRSHFDNHDEYLALYGAERIIPEMPHPRISSARFLPAELKARLGIGDMLDNDQAFVA